MAFLLKRYEVSVKGFGPAYYDAASPGKARAQAWGAYCSYQAIPFKEFLRISSVRRSSIIPEGYGRPILVGGKPAYFVSDTGHYIRFARDDELHAFLSHPLDVQEAS